jgi:hypothetical protein
MKPHTGLYNSSALNRFLHLTISIEQRLSLEAHRLSFKKFPEFLDPKYLYGTHRNPPYFSILTQNNPAHDLLLYLFKMHFNIVLEFALKFAKLIIFFARL